MYRICTHKNSMNPPLFFISHTSILELAKLSKDAYLSPETRLEGYTFVTDEDTDAQCYLSVETLRIGGLDERCIVISFRGTESAKDALIDLSGTRVPLHGQSHSFWRSFLPGNSEGALVHWGFLRQYTSILPEIRQFLKEYPNITNVITTGHSLGGALATLAVVDLSSRNCGIGRKFSCISFGSPRVGNYNFVQEYRRVVNGRSLRVVNNDDPIPLLPSSLRFHHVHGAIEIETDSGEGFIRTYIASSAQRWRRTLRVWWNTIKSILTWGEGSAIDHSSAKYCEELEEVLL